VTAAQLLMTVTAAELASVAHAAAASACRAPTLWVGSLGYEYLRQRATTRLPGAHWQLASADRHREAHPARRRAAGRRAGRPRLALL